MNARLLTLSALLTLLPFAFISRAATITWDGGGGNLSWQSPTNWSGDTLPGTGDDVIINTGTAVTIISSASVTIRSLQCSNGLALSAGTFRVTSGVSVVQGQFSVSGNPIVSATGAGTTFLLPGATSADGVGLEALSGATLSLPNLASYNKGAGCAAPLWQAAGFNSVVQAPNLTNMTGASCASFTIQALSGGLVQLPSLATISEGTLIALADGAGSVLDFSGLQYSSGTARTVSFEAVNGGTISMPQFIGGRNATVGLKPGGTLPFAQLKQLAGFTVSGVNANFSALTNLTDRNITVSSNAIVTVTNIAWHVEPAGCNTHDWLVTGPGSVLDFSRMTNLTGAACGWLNIQATAGGILNLSNVTTITEGTLNFLVDGTNSVVNLAALQQCNATSKTVSIEARKTGTIAMPLFSGGKNIALTLETGGNLPVAQFRELKSFTVTGMNLSFSALTNLTDGNIVVNGGGTVSLPNLVSHSQALGCHVNTWVVSGAGSVLDLSQLTSLIGAGCGDHALAANSGGLMILSNLPAVTGAVTFSADGSGSVMDLKSLSQINGPRVVNFAAANAGLISAPFVTGNTNIFVTLQTGGIFPAGQMRRLLGFTVSGMNVNFSALTNLLDGNVTVASGGVASAPNLAQHTATNGCVVNTWRATGAGSVLDFSGLTNLIGGTCGALAIQAMAGGHVVLNHVRTLGEGALNFLADGTNSLLDLSSLTQSLALSYNISVEARNGGVISVPALEGGETLIVVIKSGGALDTSRLTRLKSLTVSGTSLNLPGITNLFAGDLIVEQGAALSLPNLFSHNQGGGCIVNTWTVSGAGSVLELSSLTNISGSSCGSLAINALAGGVLNLSNLLTIADGTIAFLADGPNSQANLDKLQSSLALSRAVAFEVRNAGKILMPEMTGGSSVSVLIKTNGFMSTVPMRRLNSITVLGTNVIFSSLTNIDGGFFNVTSGGTVAAPNLLTYTKGSDCLPITWTAKGTGSVLNLSGLAELIGGTCVPLNIQATNGGQILLDGLGDILSGAVAIHSAGAGSLINLQSLSNFLHSASLSRLAATNAGAIQLNDQPLFLSGVTLNFAAGTPGFPLTGFSPTNLLLHGHAWRSYWVEWRDTTSELNPWIFFRRVPLTNDFQIIGSLAGPNTEFRAWEFVGEPPLLDVWLQPGPTVQVVLYAPIAQSLEVQAKTNLSPQINWELIDAITMTNTFRLLAPEPASRPQRYFRARTL